MDFFNHNCFELALKNTYFRQVLYTTEKTQLVLMSIPLGGEIGQEIHDVDQVLIFAAGEGLAYLNDQVSAVYANHVVVVPAGTKHNFKNVGLVDLKLFTIYAPPHHRQGIIHKTKAEADADKTDHY
jgi:mannose-6-phosphate isomerase-like protein (cupin superfamily)